MFPQTGRMHDRVSAEQSAREIDRSLSQQNVTAFRFGRSFFGIAVVASGVLQLVTGAFVRLVTMADPSLAGRGPGPYLVGGVLVIVSLAPVADRMRLAACSVLGVMLAFIAGAARASTGARSLAAPSRFDLDRAAQDARPRWWSRHSRVDFSGAGSFTISRRADAWRRTPRNLSAGLRPGALRVHGFRRPADPAVDSRREGLDVLRFEALAISSVALLVAATSRRRVGSSAGDNSRRSVERSKTPLSSLL
jgi:hypothetical protein